MGLPPRWTRCCRCGELPPSPTLHPFPSSPPSHISHFPQEAGLALQYALPPPPCTGGWHGEHVRSGPAVRTGHGAARLGGVAARWDRHSRTAGRGAAIHARLHTQVSGVGRGRRAGCFSRPAGADPISPHLNQSQYEIKAAWRTPRCCLPAVSAGTNQGARFGGAAGRGCRLRNQVSAGGPGFGADCRGSGTRYRQRRLRGQLGPSNTRRDAAGVWGVFIPLSVARLVYFLCRGGKGGPVLGAS